MAQCVSTAATQVMLLRLIFDKLRGVLNEIDILKYNDIILNFIILNIGCLVLTGVPGISKEGDKRKT